MESSYLDVLSAMESGRPQAEARAKVSRFEELFSELSEELIRARLRQVYAADVYFNDTLKEIRGLEALEPYLIGTARAVQSCRVVIEDVAESRGNYYLRWIMDVRFRQIARGRTTRSIGMSHLRFNGAGRIVLHQDYWDSSSGLFEHVPLLGYGIRKIKARL